MTDFVALYRGQTVSEAELVAVSAEPRLVRRFVTELLGESATEKTSDADEHMTPVFEVVSGGCDQNHC